MQNKEEARLAKERARKKGAYEGRGTKNRPEDVAGHGEGRGKRNGEFGAAVGAGHRRCRAWSGPQTLAAQGTPHPT